MKKLILCALAAALLVCGCTPPPVTEIEITPMPEDGTAQSYVAPAPDSAGIPTSAPAPADAPQATGAQPEAAEPSPAQTPPQAAPDSGADSPAAATPVQTEAGGEPDGAEKPLKGMVIGVDPGHQEKANRDTEPEAPGSDNMKHKVSSGTRGIDTGIAEYEVNLAVGLLLRDKLESAGATVVMTRTTNDVDISNIERTKLFNEKRTDYAIRLHCNGSDDHDRRGAFMLVPHDNPFKEDCERAAQLVIDEYCAVTGIKNRGLTYRSDQTGFNWCERMIINIEMGHMTNADEDRLLTDAAFQKKMADGIFKGILKFYE